MSETPRTDAMQIFLWQHDETGRTCWMKTSPGPRWNRVGVPALCLLDDARQLERALTAERERADRNQKDAERLCSLLDTTEINGDHFTWRRRNRKPVDVLRDEMDAIFGIDSARRK